MFQEGYKYFKNHLNSDYERKIYHDIYEACLQRKQVVCFDEQCISQNQVMRIAMEVYEDTPSFFYIDPYGFRTYKGNPSTLIITFIYDRETTEKYEDDIKLILMRFFDQYRILQLPVYNRLLIFHNMISSLCVYDNERYQTKNYIHEDHNIIGVFQGKISICYGFSQVFKLLCDYGNIPCLIAKGPTCSGSTHAWNIVEYDKKYYHIDVTWDLSREHNNGLFGGYLYFMVDEKWMSKTRTLDPELHYPQSQGLKYTYYVYHGYVIQHQYQLEEYFFQRLMEYPKEIVVYEEDHDLTIDYIQNAWNQAKTRFGLYHGIAYIYFEKEYSVVRITLYEKR